MSGYSLFCSFYKINFDSASKPIASTIARQKHSPELNTVILSHVLPQFPTIYYILSLLLIFLFFAIIAHQLHGMSGLSKIRENIK